MRKPDFVNWDNFFPGLKYGIILVIIIFVGIYVIMPITDGVQESRIPKYFNGTITDIKHNENWLWIIDTPDTYDFVIVNGTEERRVSFGEFEIEREVFGQVEKEAIFHIGDNVTITTVSFKDTIELQEYTSNIEK